MANKRRWIFLFSIVTIVVMLVIALSLLVRSPRQDSKFIHQMNYLTSSNNVTIQAKLIENTSMGQEESGPCYVSEYASVILALMTPCVKTSIHKADYPSVCSLKITTLDGSSTVVRIVWMGKGNLLFSNGSGVCYRREGEAKPETDEQYLDEAAALCGLISSVLAKDKKESAYFAERLRSSLGTGR